MARIHGGQRLPALSLSGFWNKPIDLGPVTASVGSMNTLSSLSMQDDFTDLFFSTGLAAHHTLPTGERGEVRLSLRREQHRSGRDVVSSDPSDSEFRPVIPVNEGSWASLGIGTSLPTPWPNLTVRGEGLAGRFKGRSFGSVLLGLDYQRQMAQSGRRGVGGPPGGRAHGDPTHPGTLLPRWTTNRPRLWVPIRRR